MNSGNAKKLDKILDEFIKKKGWDEKIISAGLPEAWEGIAGPQIANATKVINLSNGKLYIETTSSTWKSEIMLRSEEIKRRINEKYGNQVVKEIFVR